MSFRLITVIIHSLPFCFSILSLKHLVPFAKLFCQHVSCWGFQKYSWSGTFPKAWAKLVKGVSETQYQVSKKGYEVRFCFMCLDYT